MSLTKRNAKLMGEGKPSLGDRHDLLRKRVLDSATRLELAAEHVAHEAKLKSEEAKEPMTRWAGYMADEARMLREAAEEIE